MYFSALVGKGRQRADAHLDLVQDVEALGQMVGDDADESRRQAALRHERRRGALGDALDLARRVHVLGEIEVVAAGRRGLPRRQRRQVVGQRVDDRILSCERAAQGLRVVAVDDRGLHGQSRDL